MAKIPFNVSSRTAMLIGRDNIANSESAIVELIKNCYDADADCAVIVLDIPYSENPPILSENEYAKLVYRLDEKDIEIIKSKYYFQKGEYLLKPISTTEIDNLWGIFNKFNSISILDNGSGMNEDVIKEKWMTIGTDFKAISPKSKKGRIYAGAKGIGRFSLDKLGNSCDMITCSSSDNCTLKWSVNWGDFEKPNQNLDQVNADLNNLNNFDYSNFVTNIIDKHHINKEILENSFRYGTCFQINELRNKWVSENLRELYANLEILVPPSDFGFKVYLLDLNNPSLYGEVNNSICNDFDYKIEAKALSKDEVIINIYRNEFEKVNEKLFTLPKMNAFPFDKKTFENGNYKIKTTYSELLSGFEDDNVLSNIGPFSFTFYFLKRGNSKERRKLCQKIVPANERSEWLNRFGGIKIFRDNFRVKPYGNPNKGFFDWLELGDRVSKSPAGIAHPSGRWKVRPNQVSGAINISRLNNKYFVDKSSREGIQDVQEFHVFKNIIISIIQRFEVDRQTIVRSLSKVWNLEHKTESNKSEATKLANKIVTNSSTSTKKTSKSSVFSKNEETLARGLQAYVEKTREQDENLKILRVLASTGLVISSFSHELENIKSSIMARTTDLKELLDDLIPEENLVDLPDYLDPFVLIGDMKREDEKISSWLEYSLTSIKKDRRKRRKLDLFEYFTSLKRSWVNILNESGITINVPEFDELNKCYIWAFPMDLDSIFVNLISNSIYAFKEKRFVGDRKEIIIDIVPDKEKIHITYSDTGPGLNPIIQSCDRIFEPGVSTKVARYGEVVGTGLGMWIIRSILSEYKTDYNLTETHNGFGFQITFFTKHDEGIQNNEI